MEIVMIEARTYEAMMSKVEHFTQRVNILCDRNGSKDLKEWLDSQDVCEILNVTKRTLQTLRDNGRMGYAIIGHKVYYRSEDVKKLLDAGFVGKEVKNGK